MLQTLKVIGLGLLFSFIGTISGLVLGAIFFGRKTKGVGIGLSAFVIGLKDATILNPFYWLVIVLAFGAAFWMVRHKPA